MAGPVGAWARLPVALDRSPGALTLSPLAQTCSRPVSCGEFNWTTPACPPDRALSCAMQHCPHGMMRTAAV
jgi:hypothetical protein